MHATVRDSSSKSRAQRTADLERGHACKHTLAERRGCLQRSVFHRCHAFCFLANLGDFYRDDSAVLTDNVPLGRGPQLETISVNDIRSFGWYRSRKNESTPRPMVGQHGTKNLAQVVQKDNNRWLELQLCAILY